MKINREWLATSLVGASIYTCALLAILGLITLFTRPLLAAAYFAAWVCLTLLLYMMECRIRDTSKKPIQALEENEDGS